MHDQTLSPTHSGSAATATGHVERHPTVITYIKVATILALITLMEVGIFYSKFPRLAFIIVFVILSGVKFAIVVMFYMHLKFDSIIFSRFFVGGLALAAVVLLSLLSLFRFFN